MIKNLIIRPERPGDYKNTELMTMRSFWNKYFPGCTEHNMLRVIRASADYLSEISRVAELDGKIVGAVFYTKAWIVSENGVRHEVAMLAPLAVEPTLEGNDIGGALLRESIKLAKHAGIAGIILCGEPGYYPKFGFKLMQDFGITDGDGKSYDAYLCYPLSEEFTTYKGYFEESPDFEKIEDEAAIEKISKEFPAYRKVKVMDGFMQIFKEHLGVVESVEGDVFNVRYWELVIPCRLADGFDESIAGKPVEGSDVQFAWNHKVAGESRITKVIKNLLEPKISIRKLEEMASNGYVALNVMQYDGWLLRFSNGYTGRANSVSILYNQDVDDALNEKVEFCEQQYKKQGLPCIFKVTEENRVFSDFLALRGYEVVTPSYIMVLDDLSLAADETSAPRKNCGDIQFWNNPEEWLPSYFKIHEITDSSDQKTFREMLGKVLVDTIYCSLSFKGKVAACASAAIEDGYMLLQNVIVSKEFRGRGLGENICRAIIARAGENGAHHAYLQVVQTNDVALNLYKKLGFHKSYSYWYMKK